MTNLFQNKFGRVLVPALALICFLSCQKDLSETGGPFTPGPDLTTKVRSSVSGFVTDENNAAILGASVSVGGTVTTTDKYGFFEVKNVQVGKTAAVVTVDKSGYFKGIKTYMGEQDKAAFFRIKLIPKANAGSINAATGGNVTLSNGLIVALPANAVVNASNNSAYTGTVNVAAHWIDPTAADLNQTMPGDLRGISTDGALKLLTTYGMAAVELTGAGGELLQIATGKKSALTMPLPAAISGTAPASIPLWSFDETNGLWKQEGEAIKTGNTYVGEVSHFSFWNCDVPNNYVQFNCTIKDAAGAPIPNALVRITIVSSNIPGFGYTDASGYVSGAIPSNTQLLLEVFTGGYTCGIPVHSQNFTTTNVNVSLGDIVVPSAGNIAHVSGTVTDCNNNPVTNGRIIVQENTYYFSVYPISNTGSFSFSRLLCNGTPANVVIVAEDLGASQQSSSLTTTLSLGANVLGNLQACGVSTQEFITFSTNGGTTTTQFTSPGDSILHTGNGTTSQSFVYGNTPNASNTFVNFAFDNAGIGVGSTQVLTSFSSTATGGQGSATGTVVITEYGNVGQYIAGNITGVVTSTSTFNVTGSFRVRRNF